MAQKSLFATTICLAVIAGIFALPQSAHAYAIINLNTLSADTSLEAEVAQVREEEKNESVDKVIVRHKQKGALLAIFPITFTVIATAYPDGRVELRYPWYSKITLDNEKEIENRARIAVDNALKSSLVGTVSAEGYSEKPRFSEAQAEATEAELRKVLREAFENWGEDVDE